MIFPWDSKPVRQEAITDARREKELSRQGATQAADLRAEIEKMAAEPLNTVPGVARGLRIALAGPPSGAPCAVLHSGRLADCPVFISGRLAD